MSWNNIDHKTSIEDSKWIKNINKSIWVQHIAGVDNLREKQSDKKYQKMYPQI